MSGSRRERTDRTTRASPSILGSAVRDATVVERRDERRRRAARTRTTSRARRPLASPHLGKTEEPLRRSRAPRRARSGAATASRAASTATRTSRLRLLELMGLHASRSVRRDQLEPVVGSGGRADEPGAPRCPERLDEGAEVLRPCPPRGSMRGPFAPLAPAPVGRGRPDPRPPERCRPTSRGHPPGRGPPRSQPVRALAARSAKPSTSRPQPFQPSAERAPPPRRPSDPCHPATRAGCPGGSRGPATAERAPLPARGRRRTALAGRGPSPRGAPHVGRIREGQAEHLVLGADQVVAHPDARGWRVLRSGGRARPPASRGARAAGSPPASRGHRPRARRCERRPPASSENGSMPGRSGAPGGNRWSDGEHGVEAARGGAPRRGRAASATSAVKVGQRQPEPQGAELLERQDRGPDRGAVGAEGGLHDGHVGAQIPPFDRAEERRARRVEQEVAGLGRASRRRSRSPGRARSRARRSPRRADGPPRRGCRAAVGVAGPRRLGDERAGHRVGSPAASSAITECCVPGDGSSPVAGDGVPAGDRLPAAAVAAAARGPSGSTMMWPISPANPRAPRCRLGHPSRVPPPMPVPTPT